MNKLTVSIFLDFWIFYFLFFLFQTFRGSILFVPFFPVNFQILVISFAMLNSVKFLILKNYKLLLAYLLSVLLILSSFSGCFNAILERKELFIPDCHSFLVFSLFLFVIPVFIGLIVIFFNVLKKNTNDIFLKLYRLRKRNKISILLDTCAFLYIASLFVRANKDDVLFLVISFFVFYKFWRDIELNLFFVISILFLVVNFLITASAMYDTFEIPNMEILILIEYMLIEVLTFIAIMKNPEI